MKIDQKHLSCASWGVAALVLGVAYTAWAQTPPPIPDTTRQIAEATGMPAILVWAAQSGGMPFVLMAIAWWARGALGKLGGIPIVLQLHVDDRTELRKARRALEELTPAPDEPDSHGDDTDPAKPTQRPTTRRGS